MSVTDQVIQGFWIKNQRQHMKNVWDTQFLRIDDWLDCGICIDLEVANTNFTYFVRKFLGEHELQYFIPLALDLGSKVEIKFLSILGEIHKN